MFKTGISRLSVFLLVATVWLMSTMPASAEGSSGRNFRFTATPSDVVKVVLLESNNPPEYVDINIDGQNVGGLGNSDGSIQNGHWTYEKALGDDFRFPNGNNPATVEISMGVYGEVWLNGTRLSDIDHEFVPGLGVTLELDPSCCAGDTVKLDTTFTVNDPKLINKWVTIWYKVGWYNLSSGEVQEIRQTLRSLEKPVHLTHMGADNVVEQLVPVSCDSGGWFDVTSIGTFSPGDWQIGNRVRVNCP